MYKKYKKLIILISVVVFIIATFSILSFTLFGLKSIEFNFKNEQTRLDVETMESSVDFNFGECVFFSDKADYINKLEKRNPYIKVINIETVFPNKFIIHCVEREDTFAIKINENKYFICDGDLKLLGVQTWAYVNGQTNPIILDGEFTIQNLNITVGDFLELTNKKDLTSISSSLLLNNRDVSEQKAFFKSMKITYNEIGQPSLELENFDDFKFTIKNFTNKTAEKFQYLFSAFDEVLPSKYATHQLIVLETTTGIVVHETIK